MIHFRNTKLVSKEDLEYLKDLGEFCEEYFFSERLRQKLDITVLFKENHFKDTNNYADCIWEDAHYRPKEFTINFEPKQKLPVMLNTLAHEMVHVKQWAKGEMYMMMRDMKMVTFNKSLINTNKIGYWEQPWEIEAYGRASGLGVQWSQDRKHKNWRKFITE